MAIQSQPSRIPEPFAGSGTKNTIPATNATPSASQAASWASGFPPECSQPISAGGCPVPRNDVNGALNQLSQDYAFRQDGGIWEWSALADYDASRVVRGSDGLIYFSKAQSGPGVSAGAQDPTADVSHVYWDQIPTDNENVVHKTGDEDIDGEKTFLKDVSVKNGDVYLISEDNSFRYYVVKFPQLPDNHSYLSSEISANFGLAAHDGSIPLAIYQAIKANGDVGCYFKHQHTTNTSAIGYFVFYSYANKFEGYVTTNIDNKYRLGVANLRWSAVYAATGTIQTSDERLKSSISSIPDEVLDIWGSIDFVQFQFKDSIEEKGTDARLHSGLVAQRIDEAFKARGLDASRYGLFCHDTWDAQPEERDAEGNILHTALEAGDRYSLRYEEALCMEAAYQRRRADRAEARLAALEKRLAAIEAKLLIS